MNTYEVLLEWRDEATGCLTSEWVQFQAESDSAANEYALSVWGDAVVSIPSIVENAA